MIGSRVRPESVPQKMVLMAGALLATLAVLTVAWFARQRPVDLPPLTLDELTQFAFGPYLPGYIFQGIVVPAALLYLFSSTNVFRR
jgi:hypothetical protein